MNKEKQKLVPELRFPEFEKENTNSIYRKYLFTDIFTFSTGKNIKQKEAHPNFIIPCIRYGELYHMYNEVVYRVINRTNLDKSELRFSEGNEILLPSAGEDPLDMGSASALTIKNIAIGRTINILSPLKKNVYSQIYVSYYINQKLRRKISTLAKGSTISNVYNSDLKKLELSLPSLLEQKKIANCLSTLDALITASSEKLDHLKDHKKGLLQQLFPAKGKSKPAFRFPEFVEAGDWETKNKSVKIQSGNSYKRSAYSNNGIKLVQGANIFNGHYSDKNTIYISYEKVKVKKHIIVNKGDILLGLNRPITNGELKVCLYPFELGYLYQRAGILQFQDDIFGNFLYQFLCSPLFLTKLKKELVGSDQPYIKSNLFRTDILIVPSFSEQKKIANCLSSIDALIEAQTQKIATLKTHKKGLMQKLFPNIN